MRPKLLVASFVALVVVGAAGYGLVRFFAPATDHAIALVPRKAVVYASVFLKPSTAQRQAVKTILDAFPASDSSEEAEELFETLLGGVLQGSELDYGSDVKPWLGEELGAFALKPADASDPPDGALIVETHDAEKAVAAVEKALGPKRGRDRTYREIDYRTYETWVAGVVDDFVVIGTEAGFEATVDTTSEDGRSLAERADYQEALGALPEDRLALFFVDTPELLNSFLNGTGVAPSLLNASLATFRVPVAAALYAREGELVLDDVVSLPDDEVVADLMRASVADEGLLPHATGRAWAGIGVTKLGETIATLLDRVGGPAGIGVGFLERQFLSPSGLDLRKDFLDWMGDAAIYVQETDPNETLSFGAVIESTDPARSRAIVNKLHGLFLAKFRAPVGPISLQGYSGASVPKSFLEGRSGFSLTEPGSFHPINVVADGDRVYVMYGRFATFDALNGGSQLKDVLSFPAARESLGEGYRISSFLAVPPLVQVINELPTLSDGKWETETRPNLLSISHVVFGSRIEDDRLFQRLVVRVH